MASSDGMINNNNNNNILIIIGETGTISKSLRQYLSDIPGKHEIKELQKTVILGTAHTNYGKCKCKSTKYISQAK
jgi:hypothetical protein